MKMFTHLLAGLAAGAVGRAASPAAEPNIVLSLLLMAMLAVPPGYSAERPRPKPTHQYQNGGIAISIPTVDEPRVPVFGPDSIRAAARYLDDGALVWTRERTCVSCHTTGAYLLRRPMLTPLLGKPDEEVLADFIKKMPAELPKPRVSDGITYFPLSDRAVWRTAGFVQWDKHVAGKLSEHTDRALRDMLLRLSSHGGYLVLGEVEVPYVTTDFELTLHAARALVDAPGWLESLQDPDLKQRVDRMKAFLRTSKSRNDYERALRLELAAIMPELVPAEERQAAIAMLWSKQLPDGGWSTRRMSDYRNWRTPMSDTVLKLIESLPDAANPGSDPYMTAQAIVLLRESGVPAIEPRIRRGIDWLKREQRVSGRWWMHSLYRGNYQFITYIATARAMQALALCGEIPPLGTAKR